MLHGQVPQAPERSNSGMDVDARGDTGDINAEPAAPASSIDNVIFLETTARQILTME